MCGLFVLFTSCQTSKVVIGAARSLQKSGIELEAEDLTFVELEEANNTWLNILVVLVILVVLGLLFFVMTHEKSEEELKGFTGEAVWREAMEKKYGLDVDFSTLVKDGKFVNPNKQKELDNLPSAPPATVKKSGKARKSGDSTKKRN